MNLIFISDDGHGWLQVPANLLPPALRISPYSYQNANGSLLYLEEDMDAQTFANAVGLNWSEEVTPENVEGQSVIRNMRSFSQNYTAPPRNVAARVQRSLPGGGL